MSSHLEDKCATGKDYTGEIEIAIVPRTVDLGGFEVHRALPHNARKMVGPFIFWDQMGPGDFAAGKGVDVRPHPHIGLSTVTYLFAGNLDHKDSLGNDIRIVPGDINLMTAGKGIVHSERTGKDIRMNPSSLSGIQSWLAQPRKDENGTPEFTHYPAASLPSFDDGGINGRIILGSLEGMSSPVRTQWETMYIDIQMNRETRYALPGTIEELAIHLSSGTIETGGATFCAPQMVILRPGSSVELKATADVRMLLLGGAAMDSPRYIWWNFVSSSLEEIKKAASAWQDREFPTVPQDEEEFIPLPSLPFPEQEKGASSA